MSPQDSTNRGSILSRINVYTVMLLVAFLALCVACLLLAMELSRYNWDVKAAKVPRAVSLPASNALQFADLLPTYKDVV